MERTLANRQYPTSIYSIVFVTVVVVILVVIIAGTPAGCRYGPRVQYPFAAHVEYLAGEEKDVALFVTSDDRVFVGNELAACEDVLNHLLATQERTPDRMLVLSADRAASFGAVRRVIAAARDAGFRRIRVVTFLGTPLEFGFGGRKSRAA